MQGKASAGRTGAAERPPRSARARRAEHSASPLGEIELPQDLGRGASTPLPSGRHNLPRELVARSQRSRIVDAMATVVARKGYAEATIAEVLEEAGVSRATFYEHYRSKEECFDRAFAEVARRLVEGLGEVIEGPEPWADRMARVLLMLVEAIRREPAIAAMWLVEGRSATPHSRQAYEQTMAKLEGIVEASDPPCAHRCPPQIARATVSGIAGLLNRELSADRAEELPVLLPCLIYWVIAPYEGREAALAVSGATGAD